jgi:hypothetical protein
MTWREAKARWTRAGGFPTFFVLLALFYAGAVIVFFFVALALHFLGVDLVPQ